MRIVTPSQMKLIDEFAIKKLCIPGIVLMENAAIAVMNTIQERFENIKDTVFIIFAGKGNNGGDGFAIARHLLNKGAVVYVYLLCEREALFGDAKTNFSIIEKMGAEIRETGDENQVMSLESSLVNSDIIIDSIFGTGLRGEIDEKTKSIIHIINSLDKPVISIDIPSGINGESGKICGKAVKADLTVTFGYIKKGLVVYPGSEYAGEVIIKDIGLPKDALMSQEIKLYMTDREYARKIMPERLSISNKGDYGKCLIITGSEGMTGAGCLAAKAAYRTGAGLVYLGIPGDYLGIYETSVSEAISIPFNMSKEGSISKRALPGILEATKGKDAICIGPGMGWNEDTKEIVRNIIEECGVPVVIDADAINAVSEDTSILRNKKAKIIMTPHPGEMSRLIKKSTEEIQKDRIKYAEEFAVSNNVILILKGSNSIAAMPDGDIYINSTGNPGMATAGSGDVLSGIIMAVLGQGIKPEKAAVYGTYLHGLAGDIAARLKNEQSLMAGDILKSIPAAIDNIIYKGKNCGE
jgi:hydroxyethylthiazole kinase-like uncharacterized protein yjeF